MTATDDDTSREGNAAHQGGGADERDPATDVPAGWQARLGGLAQRVQGFGPARSTLAVVETANAAAAPLFAAALAFGTIFAILPMMLLFSGVLGWVLDDDQRRAEVLRQLVSFVPPLEGLFQAALEGVVQQRGALSLVGILGLVWGASNFYAGLDEVMRRIFPGGTMRGVVSRRIRGIVAVAVLVAVITGTISLSGLWALLNNLVPGPNVWRIGAPVVSLTVMIALVFAVYRLVPTQPPSRRAAFPPAVLAGLGIGLLTNLFTVLAPVLIGGLAGFGIVATIFGVFVWLNFSYQILLYGAAWARLRRDREKLAGAELDAGGETPPQD